MTGRGSRGAVATFAAVMLGVAAATLGGCGEAGDGGDEPAGPLAEAARAIEGESMRMKLDLLTTDEDGKYIVTGTGVASGDGEQATLDTKVTYDKDGPYDTEIRVLGDDIFYRFPYLELPPGIQWVRFDGTTTVAETFMPDELVAFLRRAEEAQEIGTPKLGGTPTTHYRATVDVETVLDDAGDTVTRARYTGLVGEQTMRDAVEKGGLPVDVWLGGDGRPVRVRFTAPDGGVSMDMRIDLVEYGVDVAVSPPPEKAVMTEKEFNELPEG